MLVYHDASIDIKQLFVLPQILNPSEVGGQNPPVYFLKEEGEVVPFTHLVSVGVFHPNDDVAVADQMGVQLIELYKLLKRTNQEEPYLC